MTIPTLILSMVFAATPTAAPQTSAPHPADQRFDTIVRADFFAGFAGDAGRLEKGMAACERSLAENPAHAEALVWHGSGLGYLAGKAFQNGDAQHGGELWARALDEMDRAVALAPENLGVLIPRGAMLLQATRHMPAEAARPLLEKAVGDYERVLALQSAYFDTIGDHPKGELLFGLAEGSSRLGRPEKARMYFERLIKDAPGSGHAPAATGFLATGALPPTQGLGCVGCHK